MNRRATTLRVYDTAGRLVEELVNDRLDAGEHSVVWSADRLPAGVYLLRLEAIEHARTQKVVLVK